MAIVGSKYNRLKKKVGSEAAQGEFEKFVSIAERSHYLKSYIKMMLNPKENGHSVLERCLEDAHRRSLMAAKGEKYEDQEDLPALIDQARLVLKYEWERVKDGS